MVEPRQRLRLALYARAQLVGRAARAGTQDLEGDLAVQLRVVCGVDEAHAAGAKRPEHDVAADHRAARQRQRLRRREPALAADAEGARRRGEELKTGRAAIDVLLGEHGALGRENALE